MNKEEDLAPLVREWEAADYGATRASGNSTEAARWNTTQRLKRSLPSASCYETIENWRPAHKRAPRGGKYAVPETAGL